MSPVALLRRWRNPPPNCRTWAMSGMPCKNTAEISGDSEKTACFPKIPGGILRIPAEFRDNTATYAPNPTACCHIPGNHNVPGPAVPLARDPSLLPAGGSRCPHRPDPSRLRSPQRQTKRPRDCPVIRGNRMRPEDSLAMGVFEHTIHSCRDWQLRCPKVVCNRRNGTEAAPLGVRAPPHTAWRRSPAGSG